MTEVEFNSLSAIIDEGTIAIQKGEMLRDGAISRIGKALKSAVKSRHKEEDVFYFGGQEFSLFSIDVSESYYPGIDMIAYFFNKALIKEIPKDATEKERKEIGRVKEIYDKLTRRGYVSEGETKYLLSLASDIQGVHYSGLSSYKHKYEAFVSISWTLDPDDLKKRGYGLFDVQFNTGRDNPGDTQFI